MTKRVTENPITGIVSMIHVADVERSAAFYRLLGFEIGNRVPKTGPPQWAWLYSPGAPDWRRGANLMLARTGRPLQPEAQDVLFYLYASDLVALRGEIRELDLQRLADVACAFHTRREAIGAAGEEFDVLHLEVRQTLFRRPELLFVLLDLGFDER